MNILRRPYKEIGLLLLIVACFAAVSLFFGRQSGNSGTDTNSLLTARYGIEFYHFLDRAPAGFEYLRRYPKEAYPPLYNVSAALLMKVIGRDWVKLNLYGNLPYLVILIVYCFLIGKEIKDRKTGALAVLLISLYPVTEGYFRSYSIDFALMAIMTMAFYHLLLSDGFSRSGHSLLFAFACGWGMLLKDPFAVFISGPAAFTLYTAVLRNKQRIGNAAVNAVPGIMIFLAMISSYYFSEEVLRFLTERHHEEPSIGPWYSWNTLSLLTVGISESLTGPLFIPPLAAGIYALFVKEKDRRSKILMALWIIVPTIVLWFMPHRKTTRYMLPLVPAYAIISAVGLRHVMESISAKTVFFLLALAGLAQYLYIIGGSAGKSVRFAGRQWSYYNNTDLNQPLRRVKESGLQFKAIYESIRSDYARKGVKKGELTVLVPMLQGEYGFQEYVDTYAWFQGFEVPMRIIALQGQGIEALGALGRTPENIDGIFFTVTKRDAPSAAANYHLPFSTILENYIPFAADTIENYARMTGKDLAASSALWNRLESSFSRREIIYENDEISIYHFMR